MRDRTAGGNRTLKGVLGWAGRATMIQIARGPEAIAGAKHWPGPRASRERWSRSRYTSRRNSGTSRSWSSPTRTSCAVLVRVPVGLRPGVHKPHQRRLEVEFAERDSGKHLVLSSNPVRLLGDGESGHWASRESLLWGLTCGSAAATFCSASLVPLPRGQPVHRARCAGYSAPYPVTATASASL